MIDRNALDTLMGTNGYKNWWQPNLFKLHTKDKLPPELEILAEPPPEAENYNCFVYALGLHQNKEILKETKGFIYDTFIKHLLDIGELQKTDKPNDGDFVIYQDLKNYPDNLTHIGVLDGDKVVSKWAWGPLVEHDLWDVPGEYGDFQFYIRAITNNKAKELYDSYKQFNKKVF